MDLKNLIYQIARFLFFLLYVFIVIKAMVEIKNAIEFASNIEVIYIKKH